MNVRLIKQYYHLLLRSKIGRDVSFGSLANYIKYTFFPSNIKISTDITYPLLTMYVTRKCNLDCKYCVVSKTDINNKAFDLTAEKYNEILSHPLIKKTLLVMFCGGEPLLNDNIINLVKATKENKKMPVLLTNGILLEKMWDDLQKAGIIDIQLSIYDNTVEQLKKFVRSINKEKQINASYVLLRSDLEKNADKLENVVDFANEYGFKSLKFNLCVSNINNSFIDETLKKENFEAYNDFKSRIYKKYKKLNIYFPNLITDENKIFLSKCKMPWNCLHLDSMGNFGFCCAHPPDIKNNNFNILRNDWESKINADEFCRWRDSLLSRKSDSSKWCGDCCHLYGGSYASNV